MEPDDYDFYVQKEPEPEATGADYLVIIVIVAVSTFFLWWLR